MRDQLPPVSPETIAQLRGTLSRLSVQAGQGTDTTEQTTSADVLEARTAPYREAYERELEGWRRALGGIREALRQQQDS